MKLSELNHLIVSCNSCPRLRQHCKFIGKKKKREFSNWSYWAKPVPGFGDEAATIWIIGLAPAAHGANRTGRMFTGDSSGNWLYDALFQVGYANQPTSTSIDDGLTLKNVYISAAARCAPPDNKPTKKEIKNCSLYLQKEFKLLKNAHTHLALGKIAFDTTLELLRSQGIEIPKPRPKFFHGAVYQLGDRVLVASYHPSRQNTQTGRLTKQMWLSVFKALSKFSGASSHGK